MRDAIDNVRWMREVAGDDMDICIGLHRRLTPAEAVVLARGIEGYHPMFLEDPMRFEDADAMARIADKTHIPIATGERFSTIYDFQVLFTRNAVKYERVDVCLCGGITGSRKVAVMAEVHNVMVGQHYPLSSMGLVACLQLDAAIRPPISKRGLMRTVCPSINRLSGGGSKTVRPTVARQPRCQVFRAGRVAING
jgi:galactonate dehydratase